MTKILGILLEMTKLSVLIQFVFLFFSIFVNAATLEIKSIKPLQKWEPNKIQELVLTVQLPPDFHAYSEQIKVLNINPEGFKSGQIKLSPEVEFYDKYSKKNRTGLGEHGTISILFEATDKIPENLNKIEFDLRSQICSMQVCFLPTNQHVVAEIVGRSGAEVNAANPVEPKPEESKSFFKNFEQSLQTNLPLAFLLVFLAGILTSFTPCIFPMLPITLSVLGHHAETRTRLQNFTRSLVYVLGIAVTYSSLGVIAALTGNLFGSALTNKYVLLTLCFLFFGMAFSMWGAFELQAPAFIRNRFSSSRSENNFEAFILGLVAGIVASPCVGPVLVSILTFVSTTKNAFLGFSLLFVFASGLGLIFLVIGFFGEALRFLPRSGPWMNLVKFILGACMWVAALYYLQFSVPHRWWVMAVACSVIALSVWKGAFNFKKRSYFKQSFLLMLFVSSFTVALLSLVRPAYLNSVFEDKELAATQSQLVWTPYSEEEIQKAIVAKQPVLIDFFAEWCAACHELEEKTYTDPEFLQISAGFKLIKVDATIDNEQTQQILRKYGVQGLPTVQFINRNGNLLKHLTFTQFIKWDELKPKMLESLK
ncbi:MAG: sulfite exporter TauE/SafE family protein [Bdellovibrionaceae bacterium]|nr:sulfite exporter TauE/SafE family protein [Pseudobdellovibrionaceae bacterium]MBC7457015.1 sulfite exporter TauE/SafE family protein [Pseudobdellovibrionaceae bacterium]